MRVLLIVILAAACAPPAIDLPDESPGIGFDDLRYSPRLHRVLVPAGRSGHLDLVDPDTHEVQAIGGFSTEASSEPGSPAFGVTSAAAMGTFIAVTDRTTEQLALVDPDSGSSAATTRLGSSPDYVRWIEATREL